MANGKRLLFFDLLRIVGVGLILLNHFSCSFGFTPFCSYNLMFNFLYLNPGVIGVALMVFVSGAVLEYSHPKLFGLDEISEFYVKRLFRIYPAYWMSLIIAVALVPAIIGRPLVDIFLEIVGFNSWVGTPFGSYMNIVGWYIGLIVVLYFFYPFLSVSIREHPYLMLSLIAFVEIFTKCFLNIYFFDPSGITPDRWMPFCNFLEFGLGIWVVQRGVYPKWTYDNAALFFLAEISFYVFLTHYLPGLRELITQSFAVYFIAAALIAWLVMLGDQEIQRCLKKIIDNKS